MQTAKAIPIDQASKQSGPEMKPNSSKGPPEKKEVSFAEYLLAYENEVREIDDEKELLAHLSNSSRNILAYRQAIVFKRNTAKSKFLVKAVSSTAVVDRNSPFIRWIEKIVNRMHEEDPTSEQKVFTIPAYCDAEDDETKNYPFPEFCWVPMQDGENIFGGLLVARERNWNKSELSLSTRISRLYAHAWRALKGKNKSLRNSIITKRNAYIAAIALALISMLPVSITALAPVEVIPSEPFIVTAPFSGVVKDILVDQNTLVDKGTELIQFEDVHLRNEFEIADQNEAVAQARYLRASQSAFSNNESKHELLIAKSELELASAEKEYAAELLTQSRLMAETSGLAIYTDKRDWIGKPVEAGQAVIQLADPNKIQFEINLAVKDSIVLNDEARIKVFLDSDPLNAIEATLLHASYQASPDKSNIMSYHIVATIQDEDLAKLPRIGVQGTAQIYSEKAPLIYNVFRRPLSTLRQYTGW